jgi:tripartite-type tricarboxylate transporter receptor subunit TctC
MHAVSATRDAGHRAGRPAAAETTVDAVAEAATGQCRAPRHPARPGAALGAALAACLPMLATLVPAGAAAQSAWPSRGITMIVPFTPGTGVDQIARGLGSALSTRLAVAVVVDNRAGASGNIGAEAAAKSPADGHTLLVTAGSMISNAAINRNLRYDALRAFAPVSLLATGAQTLVVGTASPLRSTRELVAAVRARPGKLFYGTPGNGTPHHLAMELFKLEAGLDIVHVPYKGFGGALTDLLGGRLDAMVMPLSAAVPYVQNGQARMLAIVADERVALYPAVPTLAEEGFPKVQASNWYALLAPAGTPGAVVAKLNAEANAILGDAGLRESLAKQGFIPAGGAPERLAELMKAEFERWTHVAADAQIKAD